MPRNRNKFEECKERKLCQLGQCFCKIIRFSRLHTCSGPNRPLFGGKILAKLKNNLKVFVTRPIACQWIIATYCTHFRPIRLCSRAYHCRTALSRYTRHCRTAICPPGKLVRQFSNLATLCVALNTLGGLIHKVRTDTQTNEQIVATTTTKKYRKINVSHINSTVTNVNIIKYFRKRR